MAKDLFEKISNEENNEVTLDFTGIQFASRSFMVQLYSMLAKQRSQVRFVNMNENVDRMYLLAIRAYNRPAVIPAQMKKNPEPELLNL
ncbi:MAG: hypothetical protein EA391_12450 [Balneolaceae bacterium]|nr:MAG: hypothetical protein EA391_12450 [Balneolaceae bacterium]